MPLCCYGSRTSESLSVELNRQQTILGWTVFVSLCLYSGGWRSRSHSPAVSWERLGGQPIPTRHRAGKSTHADVFLCSLVTRTRHRSLFPGPAQWFGQETTASITRFIVGHVSSHAQRKEYFMWQVLSSDTRSVNSCPSAMWDHRNDYSSQTSWSTGATLHIVILTVSTLLDRSLFWDFT